MSDATGKILGTEPAQVLIDELATNPLTPEMLEELEKRILAGASSEPQPSDIQHHYQIGGVTHAGQSWNDFWGTKGWVKAADRDVRENEAYPGDQTYTHDATVATIPVDVALRLCAEHPILQSLVKFHNVEDNKGDTDKLCQGAAIDLAMSVLDAGHVWKQARKATPQDRDRWLRQAQKVANFAQRYGVRGNAYRGIHVEHPEAPQAVLNSNPQKSGARAKRKAKRKTKK